MNTKRTHIVIPQQLDHSSLNIDTFNPVCVLMGYALPQEAQSRAVQRAGPAPSGDTSKPASRGHLKTGQLSASRTPLVLPHRQRFRQQFFGS
ncbi:MAG: hypothetical protein ABSC93_22135, partial [Bryobacteraceae bacterium]